MLAYVSYRGYKRFFKRSILETSDYLKNDCLKLECTVGVVVSGMDCSGLHPVPVPESDIGTNFGMLLENKLCSDIVFDVSGEKFHAHKLVLAARSPVFRSDFYEKTEDEKGEILVTDVEPEVFKVRASLFSSFPGKFSNSLRLSIRTTCFIKLLYVTHTHE